MYSYITTDNLKHPQNYMFSGYGGEDFLKAYFKTRNSRISSSDKERDIVDYLICDIDKENDIQHNLLKCCLREENSSFELSTWFTFWQHATRKDTKQILAGISLMLLSVDIKDVNDAVYELLSIFVKKFEVSKRLSSCYGVDCKRMDKEENTFDPSIYVYLSLSALLFYEKTQNLKFLNAALKLNDTICSMEKTIKRSDLRCLFNQCLRLETGSVERILHNKGIQI